MMKMLFTRTRIAAPLASLRLQSLCKLSYIAGEGLNLKKFLPGEGRIHDYYECENLMDFAKEYKKLIADDSNSPLLISYGNQYFRMIRHADPGSGNFFKEAVLAKFPGKYNLVCGPSHGLFCLYSERGGGEVALWNPATGDIKNLTPELPCGHEIKIQNVGFGFDSKADDYKIVRSSITRRVGVEVLKYRIEIYSLKTKQWREIAAWGEIASHLPLVSPGSFTDGVFYWTNVLIRDNLRLYCLDTADEQFRIQSIDNSPAWNSKMDTFHGLPAVMFYRPRHDDPRFDYGDIPSVWVRMPDLTWVCQLRIDFWDPFDPDNFRPGLVTMPQCIWKNKALISTGHDYNYKFALIWHDFNTKRIHLSNVDLPSNIQPQPFTEDEKPRIKVLNFPETFVVNPW